MQEILFIALIVLLFFGGKKIPELMKGLGKGVKSFKEGMNGVEDDIDGKDKNGGAFCDSGGDSVRCPCTAVQNSDAGNLACHAGRIFISGGGYRHGGYDACPQALR